jgi:hypothetical protein
MARDLSQSFRNTRGNMLAIITAVTIGILAIISFFALSYVRLLGSSNEQKTAIEAAAMSAARDLGKIAINTPEVGWLSLSDSAPTGTATIAGDQYKVPVRSVNSLMGTLRLDLIIADRLGDQNLKVMVKEDLKQLKNAQLTLEAELRKSLNPGYSSKDINGQTFELYKNAEAAYLQNLQRMVGTSNYKANSLKLSLGSLTNGAPTNIKLPQPETWANVQTAANTGGFYRSYVNIPYDNQDFVFAGIGDAVKLVDPKDWTSATTGLSYQLPTIVKAEASQDIKAHMAGNAAMNVQSAACAQPANIIDPHNSPGALTFSFPDGLCAEITNPGSMLTNSQLNSNAGSTSSFLTSANGDFPMGRPTTAIVSQNWPYPSMNENCGNYFRRALLDWWKRAGTKLNMQSAQMMITDPSFAFKTPTPLMMTWKSRVLSKSGNLPPVELGKLPAGNIHIYKVDPSNGTIIYTEKDLTPVKLSVAGQNQAYMETMNAITGSTTSTKFQLTLLGIAGALYQAFVVENINFLNPYELTDKWDVYIRDQVYQPGSVPGNYHNGEPMDFDKTAYKDQMPLALAASLANQDDLGNGSLGANTPPGKGQGKPPSVTSQSDFGEDQIDKGFFQPNATYYNMYSQGPGNANRRPTYETNGMAVDVRFRRQMKVNLMGGGSRIGYVGDKK